MSQFDFPRVNFHGSALLDVATANNGNYQPNLTMFDQDNSTVYLPPRCYSPGGNYTFPAGYPTYTDKNGTYALIEPINAGNYQAWATTPLGSFPADAAYIMLYTSLSMLGKTPGYWNYYGDLSVQLQDVAVTGITLFDSVNGSDTYTPQNQAGCPADMAALLGAGVSFNLNYGTPGSRTSAYMSDVDSMGQMCTQIFCSTVGLYDASGTPFFTGTPVKSTAKYVNLSRVLNYVNNIPMGGSASFYAMVEIAPGSPIITLFEKYAGVPATCLFMKLLIHEVYEVRNPDYNQLLTKTYIDINGNATQAPKNPSVVSITGSFTPWYPADMQTQPFCRILKSSALLNIDNSGIINPIPLGSTSARPLLPYVNLGPALFYKNQVLSMISLDLSNTLNEYGTTPGPYPSYAGTGDFQPFTQFVNYNYGDLTLVFTPDNSAAITVGIITYNDYNMPQFLATSGMVDLLVQPMDYTTGTFQLFIAGAQVMMEDEVFLASDLQGMYADQNQQPANLYLSHGLPKEPFVLRVNFRGVPVSNTDPVQITVQWVNLVTGAVQSNPPTPSVYDGISYTFPVDQDGCLTYVFAYSALDLYPTNPNSNPILALLQVFNFFMRANMMVVRVLKNDLVQLPVPVTWQQVFDNIFVLYKTLYPVMDLILPMNEATWSDPTILGMARGLIDMNNWNTPMFMPVTRDMTAPQRQLFNAWISQNTNA